MEERVPEEVSYLVDESPVPLFKFDQNGMITALEYV